MNAFIDFMTAAGPWILMGLGLAIVTTYFSHKEAKNKEDKNNDTQH